jgi:acyl-CoA reductase-like NAD-dependent aldehyde dehydrogenase
LGLNTHPLPDRSPTNPTPQVMAAAAPRVTPVTLELGGKDAFVVCNDADLGQVVPIAVKAAFLNCGQNCASGERYVVERGVYDKFCQKVAETARMMRQGPALGHGEGICWGWGCRACLS